MKVVGIKQLKARLSEYIRLAKMGETVLVAERDQVVAELRPARHQAPVGDGVEEILETLAAAGEVTRAAYPKGDWVWHSRGLAPGTAQRLLDELRHRITLDRLMGSTSIPRWLCVPRWSEVRPRRTKRASPRRLCSSLRADERLKDAASAV